MYAAEMTPETSPVNTAMPALLRIEAVDPMLTPSVMAPIMTSLKPILLLSVLPSIALPIYTPIVLPEIAHKMLKTA